MILPLLYDKSVEKQHTCKYKHGNGFEIKASATCVLNVECSI